MKNVILLNNLFSGKYILKEIGGEIINMHQSDNGKYYIYVNPYGNIASKWDNKIKYVLFIRSVSKESGMVKVIGKAAVKEQISVNAVKKINSDCDPYQKEYIDKNNITYGGVPVYLLGSWSSYFVTFEVEGVYKSKKDIYLTTNKNSENRQENVYFLEGVKRINNQSQKLYIEKDDVNYEIINKYIINNKDLWESEKVKQVNSNDSMKTKDHHSFLSIIKKENDELVISNLLAYFLENDKKFLNDFLSRVLNVSVVQNPNEKPIITREVIGNIDILIEIGNNVFVIENKIKSYINGKDDNGYSQLEKYYKIINESSVYSNKHKYFYLLRPDYNNENYKRFNNGDKYCEIKYSSIYEIIKNRNGGIYFEEFKKVVKKHSSEYGNQLFEIMSQRFIDEIKNIKSKL